MRVVESETVPSEIFRDGELGVVGAYLSADRRDRWLADYAQTTNAAAMLCPHECRPNARWLILHQEGDRDPGFLAKSARLCRELALPPVVLTVAATERRADVSQARAREALCEMDVDFDLVAGCELRMAVEHAARARGCAGVMMACEPAPPWWRRFGTDPLRALLGLTHSLGLVLLPRTASGACPRLRKTPRD
jgi:hypothetical protein